MTNSSKGSKGPAGSNVNGRTSEGSQENGAVHDARAAVGQVADGDLAELYRFWAGPSAVAMPADGAEVRKSVLERMADPVCIEERTQGMGRRLVAILDAHLAAPGYELTVADLAASRQLAYLSQYDFEAALASLVRHALLVPTQSREVSRFGNPGHAIPVDVGDALLRQRRSKKRGIFDVFTLKGHLERVYADPSRANGVAPSRLREMYKMYSKEAAAVARVERLPEGLRSLVGKVILQFGGLLPRGLFERMEHDLPHWNGRRWSKLLEESLVGTVERLELGRYGLNHSDETLLVFNEVALAWLKRVAVPGDPDQPHDEASIGVDLASNISRFLGFILENDVRFTVRGEIFKTTEKRIQEELIPNPGRELERSEVLDFIYRFTRHARLIESTGERTFTVTARGREWEPQSLEDKLRILLEYTLEERELGGEYFHQARMRRIYLRMLKRVEPGVWYDLMYLPFLARNSYLASLDDLAVEDYFSALSHGTGAPLEDLQRLAWNLVGWVKKRLYLLGIVDLGYDKAGRPVAMRLSRAGARLLGIMQSTREQAPSLGNLVVTPDYQVVLFPTGDDAELVHDLDRFCERDKQGELMHFRITERGVTRALQEGLSLSAIVGILQEHSRTPVPQNVLYSVRDWATRAGLLVLGEDCVLRSENADVVRRLRSDPGVRPYVARALGEHGVQLKKEISPRRLQALLRDLDYLVEREHRP